MILELGQHVRTRTYAQALQDMFGSAILAYLPLDDKVGTVARDLSLNGYSGTYGTTQPTYAAVLGPGRTLCPTWAGTSGAVTLPAGLKSAFNGAEGAISLWLNPTTASWTDGNAHYFWYCFVDANNVIRVNMLSSQMYTVSVFGGTDHSIVPGNITRPTWFNVLITWSASQSRFRAYVNSGILRQDDTALGTWAGTPGTILIGTSSAQYFLGNMSDYMVLNRYVTFSEAQKLVDWSGLVGRITVLGDSISDGAANQKWPAYTCNGYTALSLGLNDRAVAGMGIVAGATPLSAQAANSASDNAQKIIIALGAADDNAGNMTTLQAAAESGIASLKGSNPSAKIYWMNVLPQWTDNTGSTPVDKSNIRTAVAAACTSQGITCWDTFSTPWITAAQTSDGVHPTTAGHNAIATQVLARL